jgi:3-isopropylmalate/(R)-2-methylmalate dehydratase small subunit
MKPFVSMEGIAMPMPSADVNTDQIIPARFLRKQRADGFGQYLFNDLRFDEEGSEQPDFVLNQPAYRHAQIIVAGDNFGCGSSREMAVWAIADYGFRALIAPSFADIFYNNCIRNGLLPISLPAAAVAALIEGVLINPARTIRIDLQAQLVSSGAERHPFDIDPFHKKCLIQGIDGLDYTLRLADRIAEYERRAGA